MTIIFPLGKHKGEPISKVIEDTNYCRWLSEQEWFSKGFPELKRILVRGRLNIMKRGTKKVKHKPILHVKSNPIGICLN